MNGSECEGIYAGVSDEAVLRATGRDWAGWFAELDALEAETLPHRAIAGYLNARAGLSFWWSQMVTIGYEQARGLREKHQKGARFQISKGRTIDAPVSAVFKAWADEGQRESWLPGQPIRIRKANPDQSMRITWSDERTNLNVYFTEKGAEKSQVSIQHGGLANAEEAEAKKEFWGDALGRLKGQVEGSIWST